MPTPIEPMSSEKEAQVEPKKMVILCAAGARSILFWPAQNILFIHEHDTQRKVELGYSSSRILEILIDRADAIVSREDIFAFAWPDRIVGQNSLNQAISTIRELLADEDHRAIIQTIPRRGYQFNSQFLVSGEPALAPDERGPTVEVALPLPLPLPLAAPRLVERVTVWGRHNGLLAILILLVASLAWRIDWSLWIQPGLVKDIDHDGLLTVWYTGETPQELRNLKDSTAPVRGRILQLLEAPGTVIFNTMHSFYEIVCISGSTVEFISVHKSKLQQITDEQLGRCLK